MKPIPDFDGRYFASEAGDIYNIRGRKMAPATNNRGYRFVNLRKDGASKCFTIHRLVAITYLGAREGMEVNHKNGIRHDNRLDNLEWLTRSDNFWHGYRGLGKFTATYLAKSRPKVKWQDYRRCNLSQIRAVIAIGKDIGFYFPSVAEAARSVSGQAGHIVSCAKGLRQHHAGHKWQYVGEQ